jgi:hypothetical protein
MRYERGSGAWLGAALRREPATGARLLNLRMRYQVNAFRHNGSRFGIRALSSFLGGLGRGLTYGERHWVR